MLRLIINFILVFGSFSLFAQEERIISYDVQLEVNADRSLLVTEFIKVFATGRQIKRGITRDLPLKRYLKGHQISTEYNIMEVLRDNRPEPYFVQSVSGNKILYIGQKDYLLPQGEYSYKIKYIVPNQIGFYNDYDEIYWNAIGTNVQFLIEQASCRIKIPRTTKVIQESGYTGRYGGKSKDYTLNIENSYYDYRLNRALQSREGFSIAVGFEKGYFKPPGLLTQYGSFIIVLLTSLFLLIYFVKTWWNHGRDPISPVPYPIFEAPNELSASSASYILKESYSKNSLTGAIIHLAIKGYIKIDEIDNSGIIFSSKAYELQQIKSIDNELPDEELRLLQYLFESNDTVAIDGKYKSHVALASSQHKSSLSEQHYSFLSKGNNTKLLILPLVITLAAVVVSFILISDNPYASGINLTILLIFIPAAIIGLILYYYLIKKPSIEKLALKSQIKGFKMYLEMAEKDRLQLLNPPDMTPEHFEAALPYAFAMGIEHKWSKTFENILEKANYQPSWSNNLNRHHFASHFGNEFGKDMRSTTTQPQSSGGSGGGGFSGGGGGGGGVGGW